VNIISPCWCHKVLGNVADLLGEPTFDILHILRNMGEAESDNWKPAVSIMNWFLMVTAVLFVCIRLGTKYWIFRRWTTDDYFSIAAAVLCAAQTLAISMALVNGLGEHHDPESGVSVVGILKVSFPGLLPFPKCHSYTPSHNTLRYSFNHGHVPFEVSPYSLHMEHDASYIRPPHCLRHTDLYNPVGSDKCHHFCLPMQATSGVGYFTRGMLQYSISQLASQDRKRNLQV
jgi:hypothetical protein